jgi:hypothetical protein
MLALVVLLWLWLRDQFHHQNRKLDHIMTAVQVEQEELDTVAASVEDIAVAISNLPPESLPAGVLDGINKSLADAQAAISAKTPEVPTPVADSLAKKHHG